MTVRTILRCAAPGLLLAGAIAGAARADSPGGRPAKMTAPVSGEQVYKQICQACHMADARGSGTKGAGAIPALAKNPKLANADYPITILLKGKGAMPWMTDMLKPAQMAAVVGYVRTHFGNNYPKPVTEADVRRLSGGGSSSED